MIVMVKDLYIESLIPVEGHKKILSNIERLFTDPRSRKKDLTRLRELLFQLLIDIDVEPISSVYTVMFTIDNYNKISRTAKGLKKYSEKFLEKFDASEREILILLRILRGLGYIEFFKIGNRRLISLTTLGALVKDFINKKEYRFLEVLVFPSLVFRTKARLVYGLYNSLGYDLRAWYQVLMRDLFEENLRGSERIAIELLHEIVLTAAGSSPNYYPESILFVKIFGGLAKSYGDLFKELFIAVNEYVRREWSEKMPTRFPYKVSTWGLLDMKSRLSIDEIEKQMKLKNLRPLLDQLKINFESIENQFLGLYEFPRAY